MKSRHKRDKSSQRAHRSNQGTGKHELRYKIFTHPSIELKRVYGNHKEALYAQPDALSLLMPLKSFAGGSVHRSHVKGRVERLDTMCIGDMAVTLDTNNISSDSAGRGGSSAPLKEVTINYPHDDPADRKEYKGTTKGGRLDGHGTLVWSSGSKYIGQFKGDSLTGRGTYRWSNGKEYTGEWHEGRANGFGILRSHGSKCTGGKLLYYDGMWKDGLMSGNGIAKLANGDVYRGDWFKNCKHGRGVYKWANGCKYVGRFMGNMMHGKGVYSWPNSRALALEFERNVSTDALAVSSRLMLVFMVASCANLVYSFYSTPSLITLDCFISGINPRLGNIVNWVYTVVRLLLPEARVILLLILRAPLTEQLGYFLHKACYISCMKRSNLNVSSLTCWREGLAIGCIIEVSLFSLTFLI